MSQYVGHLEVFCSGKTNSKTLMDFFSCIMCIMHHLQWADINVVQTLSKDRDIFFGLYKVRGMLLLFVPFTITTNTFGLAIGAPFYLPIQK